MASAQPLNTEIAVFRRVRSQMANDRHDSVKQMTGEMRPRYVVVPAEEVRVLETKDSVVTDAWRYGHPVVRYNRSAKTPATVYDGVTGLDFPVRLTAQRRDLFITKTEANVGDDLFQDVRDA